MIVTFCGHSDCVYDKEKKDSLKSIIKEVIKSGATEFLLGGYGAFDLTEAVILNDFKNEYTNFKTILVIPYVNRKYDMELYDYSIYPPIEHIPLKFAISERNKWMVDNSDIIISSVMRNYGCAAKTLNYAKKQGKYIISVLQ